jgi:sarcosine oxidase delta subunit
LSAEKKAEKLYNCCDVDGLLKMLRSRFSSKKRAAAAVALKHLAGCKKLFVNDESPLTQRVKAALTAALQDSNYYVAKEAKAALEQVEWEIKYEREMAPLREAAKKKVASALSGWRGMVSDWVGERTGQCNCGRIVPLKESSGYTYSSGTMTVYFFHCPYCNPNPHVEDRKPSSLVGPDRKPIAARKLVDGRVEWLDAYTATRRAQQNW